MQKNMSLSLFILSNYNVLNSLNYRQGFSVLSTYCGYIIKDKFYSQLNK